MTRQAGWGRARPGVEPAEIAGERRRGRGRYPVLAAALIALVVVPTGSAPSSARADDPAVANSPGWSWPVAPELLARGYEAPATRYGAGHRGIDLAALPGTPVLSPDDGVVRFAGVVVDRPLVSIDHGGGIVSSFEPVTPEVGEGQHVARGQRVGVVASAAHCAGGLAPGGCVHIGARLHGEYFSPLALLGGIPRAVLLPVD